VFDLGLSAAEVAELTAMMGTPPLKLNYSQFPDFFNIRENAGCYAWKPAAICAAMSILREADHLVWLDAGCLVRAGFREAWTAALRRTSVVSPRSSGLIRDWAHPACVRALGIGPDVLNRPNLSGGVVGFRTSDPRAQKLAARWLRWAHDRAIIAPHGSSRENHRQDQTLLSILVAQTFPAAKPIDLADLCVQVHKDDDDGCT
jgi:hypothetical protein